MQCPYCGNDVPPGVSSCPSCGASVPENARNPSVPAVATRVQYAQRSAGQGSAKSQTAYILLAVFFGYFGVHNFYAGYTGKAFVQLLITILSCGCAFFIPYIWAIIEICTVNQDAKGIPFA